VSIGVAAIPIKVCTALTPRRPVFLDAFDPEDWGDDQCGAQMQDTSHSQTHFRNLQTSHAAICIANGPKSINIR